MKTKLTALWLALAFGAGAQIYLPLALTYTNAVPDNSTNSISTTNLDMRRYEELALQIRFQMNQTYGVGPSVFRWKQSLDNTNDADNFSHSFLIAANGTNFVTTNLTLQLGALGWIKLHSAGVATNGAAMTNLTILYTPKPFRREKL